MTSSDPMPRPLLVTLAQITPRKGAVERNLARVREEISRVAGGTTDLLVFPESVLSGYVVEGGVADVARTAATVAGALGPPPQGAPDVVLGFYEDGGGEVYNAAVYLTPDGTGWRLVHRHRKAFLPTYGVFQEARFVTAGTELRAFDTRFGRVGLLVCEDMLHSLCPTLLTLDGADLLVALAATPARDFRPTASGLPASLESWDVAGRAITLEHGCHLLVAHLTGSEGGKLFAGGSVAYGPGGEVLARAPLFEEASLAVPVDPGRVHRARRRSPLAGDLRVMLPHLERGLAQAGGRSSLSAEGPAGAGAVPGEQPAGPGEGRAPSLPDPDDATMLELELPLVQEALVWFLRQEIRDKRGFDRVVVGVSGGVDSAVSLELAVRALGADRVHAFLLPYATSSPDSLAHGRLVAERAGVACRTIPVAPGVDAYIQAEEAGLSNLRRGNLAARFRSLVLWDQAASLGALPLGTGNKSERLMGYFTWHADDAPPVNPLGDLYKTQVWALARHLGLPEAVVDKPASADLVPGVDDEAELGVDYRTADRILYWLLEGLAAADLVAAGFGEEAVGVVDTRLRTTHWKRHLPTVAMVSSTAIGQSYLRPVDF